MTDSQRTQCHAIIHTATAACAAVGGGMAQLPMADAIPITGLQITMVISLGKVFDKALTESAAKAIIAGVTGSSLGRLISQMLVGWIPGWGNAINATTAASITEALGWKIAEQFDSEANN